MNHRTSGEKMKCFMNPTQWFVLGQKEKNITFLKSNLFQWKKLSIEFFFIIFLALETCLVAVSIGNCTFCFWGEITCGSVDWHKLAYRRNISLTKKWKWEFIFFADGRPQVEEIWILDSFCTKHIFERLQHVFVVCDSVLYEFLFASWHGLQKWRKFISQTTKKLDNERLHRMDETSMDISTVLMWLFKEIWGSARDRETVKSVEYDRLALL